jgi:hypothetical protein
MRKLHNARRNAIEKIAVVRYEQTGAPVVCEKSLQPLDRAGVKMVSRLIENQEIRPGKQRAAKRAAPFLATGQRRNLAPPHRCVQVGNQALDPILEIPFAKVVNLIEQKSRSERLPEERFCIPR